MRAFCLIVLLCLAAAQSEAGRLEDIEQRGHLICGVYPGVAGFATVSKDGRYSGFDIDICRAVATAILGNPDKVQFVVASGLDVFKRTPGPDMVVRRLTWTLTREAPLGLMFGPIVYYDGQGFLVPRSAGIASARQLAGKHVCVDGGEDWLGNLMRYSRANGLDLKPVVAVSRAQGEATFYEGRRCDAYSADKTMLGAIRADAPKPDDYDILPEQISKEPLAPLVRAGDDRFFQVVRWTILALIEAEELGISSQNIEKMKESPDPDVKALLGIVPGNGKALGLNRYWAANVIESLGNYGEIFARNVGADSPIKLDRGLNRLWTDGGLMYAPPVR